MKKLLLTLLLCNALGSNAQSDQIKSLQGIWIAEPFLNSFEKTSNIIESKLAFDASYPVGLRINEKEIENGILNVGYASLHDHLIRPEVSKYLVAGEDSIHEQGHFEVALKADSAGYFLMSETYSFNFQCNGYFSWNFKGDTSLMLYRPATGKVKEAKVIFKRITRQFEKNNPYPNPIYYYTRSKTLTGNYTLKDGQNKTIATNFTIHSNGLTQGYLLFENRSFYYSTDIYCGPPETHQIILVCTNNEQFDPQCKVYIYERPDETTIQLYNYKMDDEIGSKRIKTHLAYTLIKN